MPKVHLTPDTIHQPGAYSHVVVVEQGQGRLAFVSGQIAYDRDGNLVGRDDLPAQTRQCFVNLRAAVEAVGGTPSDFVKLTMFIVGYDPSMREMILRTRDEVLQMREQPASTLLGVAGLARDGLLFEVEGTALLS